MTDNKAKVENICNIVDIKSKLNTTLSEKELNQLLNDFNPPATEYPSHKCIHHLFEEQVERTPNKIALEYQDETWTYKQLNEASNHFARSLETKGVKRNQLVAICVNRSPELLIGLLAILKLGCAYIPLDPIYPTYRLEQILNDSKVNILITKESVLDSLPNIDGQIIKMAHQKSELQMYSVSNLLISMNSDNLAYLIYTSGSTGQPKGVQISHKAFVNFIVSMAKEPGISEDDIILAITTIAFDIAGLELFLPISYGAKVVIGSERSIKDPFFLMDEIERSGATIFQGTPVAWKMLLEAGWKGKSDLKALCGGEALSQDLAQKLTGRCQSLWNLYGPTETTVWSSLKEIKEASISNGYESIGKPIANTQIYILDSEMNPVPIGVEGELHIGGDGLSTGYFNKEELTKSKFVSNPFNAGTIIYNTGDLARWLPDGNIDFLGRSDFQVKIRGFRIELSEIETCLLKYNNVKEAIVTTRESKLNGKRLVAYIATRKHLKTDITDLRNFMKTKLPEYMLPSEFVLIKEFPTTPNGKIDRKTLFDIDLKKMNGASGILIPVAENQAVLIDEETDANILPEFIDCKELYCYCNTHRSYPNHKTLVDLFEEQVNRTPDETAVIFKDSKLTYSELNEKSNQFAHYLLNNYNVSSESLVTVMLERSEWMIIAIYGILKSGAAYVPIDPDVPSERIAFILNDTNSPVLVTEKFLTHKIKESQTEILDLTLHWNKIKNENHQKVNIRLDSNNLAYVIYTSGSTGLPKGVMNEHAAICNRLFWMQEEFKLEINEKVLQKTPYSFDVSVWEIFWPLQVGACMIIALPSVHKDSKSLVQTIKEQEVSTIHFVPSMLEIFLKDKDVETCTSLKRIICSGERLSYQLQESFFNKLDVDLFNLYGPTEAAVDVTYWKCDPNYSHRIVPIGLPIANTYMYILDENLQPVPKGQTGELFIGGIQVARGYLNRIELTEEKFIQDPFMNKKGARLYKTGDMVRSLEDNNIEFLNRIDHQVKIMGYRIELGEIEANLVKHESIENAVVMVSVNESDMKTLIAYLVASGSGDIDQNEIQAYLKNRLPDYMVPNQFIILNEMPLNPNGKIDRNALPEAKNHITKRDYISPQNQTEGVIAKVWSHVLQIEKPGIHENFFEIGGNSLLIIRVAAQLKEKLKSSIEVIKLFEYPTIQLLAKYIDSKEASQPSMESITNRNLKKKEVREQRRKNYTRR